MSTSEAHDSRWHAVLERDAAHDGAFVYAVRTTGIFCRPTCPSRRPQRGNVEFFDTCADAEAAGYRACQRCHPTAERAEPHRDLVVAVCRYLEAEHEALPTLEQLGERFALSAFHLQRVFKRIVGVSPKQYADACRQARLKAHLREEDTVTDALYAAGYGTSSRLYEQTGATLGMTPVHYRSGGALQAISYTLVESRLGWLLVAATERGVCKISLADSEADLYRDLAGEFPEAQIVRDDAGLALWVQRVVDAIDGERTVVDLPLDIQATSFQRKVWEALRTIAYGETKTYTDVAALIGQPGASRAVARACATNPVALVIPCHRVVRQGGELAGYRWGLERKRMLLAQERAAMVESVQDA